MQFNITIDAALIRQARKLTGVKSDRELMELGLRTLIRLKTPTGRDQSALEPGNGEPEKNRIAELLESDFIGCAATDDTDVSGNYKAELTAIIEKKHGHR